MIFFLIFAQNIDLGYTLEPPLRGTKFVHFCDDSLLHYENTPIQYTVIFHDCKNDNFQV